MPESEATRWERIRWSDDDPLPQRGSRVTFTSESYGMSVAESFVVVDSRVDFEPGWVQVEVDVRSATRHVSDPAESAVDAGAPSRCRANDLAKRSLHLTDRGSELRRESDDALDRSKAERGHGGHPSETSPSVDPPDADA